MTNQKKTKNTSIDDNPYAEIITAIVKRFARLSGMPTALHVARKIPELSVDDEGNVLGYNIRDPIGTINFLIDQHEVLYGEIARSLAIQATQPLATDKKILDELGFSEELSSHIRILLVDDHTLFLDGLVSLLNSQPDVEIVGQAGSVQEAVALARSELPDIILMDISLPDGTGMDAALAIRSESPKTKIVILTVHEDEEKLFEAIRAGAIGYLFKNVRVDELLNTLRGVMRGEAGISRTTAHRILDQFALLSQPHPDDAVTLTAREIEILRELSNNATNQEIAKRLYISENTVKNHVRNVLVKLHFHSRNEAADYARRHGLTQPPPYESV